MFNTHWDGQLSPRASRPTFISKATTTFTESSLESIYFDKTIRTFSFSKSNSGDKDRLFRKSSERNQKSTGKKILKGVNVQKCVSSSCRDSSSGGERHRGRRRFREQVVVVDDGHVGRCDDFACNRGNDIKKKFVSKR